MEEDEELWVLDDIERKVIKLAVLVCTGESALFFGPLFQQHT